MLSNLFSAGGLQVLAARVIVLLTALPVHEYAHAWAADKMGDPTARFRKRLTLNPLDHIDPIGAIMILLFGVGFAKPVPINSMNFTRRRYGIVIASLAGPFANILMALVSLIIFKALNIAVMLSGLYAVAVICAVFLNSVFLNMTAINLTLAVFNLLPIPPLDGWHAISQLLPSNVYWKVAVYEQQITWIVILLVFLGAFDIPLYYAQNALFWVLDKLTFFMDVIMVLVR